MARPETLAAALRDVDRAMLISSSDPMMLDVQSNFIDAAAKAGVRHVVKLSGIMPELDSAFRFARIAASVLTSSGHEGKTYPLTGPQALTMTEVAEKLSTATGKTIRYINVP